MNPTPLIFGQTLGVCAPGSYVDPARVDAGKAVLEKAGFNVLLHPQSKNRYEKTQLSGTLTERLNAFHDLINNKDVHGIIFAGGGNRSLELVPHLDYAAIAHSKKVIIGMSDATALINSISVYAPLTTFHGPMLNWLASHPENDDVQALIDVISGAPVSYNWAGDCITQGAAKGPLFGGNISVLIALLASGSLKIPDGAILFLEDIGEELNRLDRAYLALAQLAARLNIAGIIIGQNVNLIDTGRPFGFREIEIARYAFGSLGIPVAFNAPFGHGPRLITLPVGHNVTLECTNIQSTISFESCCM